MTRNPSVQMPRFLTTDHADPFWRQQAAILTATWQDQPEAPPIGVTWRRGEAIADAYWPHLRSRYSTPITCDPEHPDTPLLRELGEALVDLRRLCVELKLDHFTTARMIHGLLTSVLFESEVEV